MHFHCGTNNRAPRWTFTDPCKPEVRPGAQEESAVPAWLAALAMNGRWHNKSVYMEQLQTFTLKSCNLKKSSKKKRRCWLKTLLYMDMHTIWWEFLV